MTETILTAVGLPFRRSRFLKPPTTTYAVYTDDVETSGSDCGSHRIHTHNVTVEVYEPKPDDKAEAAIEAAICSQGLNWSKQDRYWLQEEQRYQVIYEFTYYTKQ